jgi:putative SOS response-associated peptidase YedK
MCARVTLTIEDIDEIAGMLDAELSPDDAPRYRRRYNVAPSDTHWMLEYGADGRVLMPAKWGYLPTGRSGRPREPLINVRGEQVASGHGFREAFASRRCAVVTDGFFEWNERREPFWYHRPDGGLVLLAGLFHEAPAATRDRVPRFTVLTTRPNKLIAVIHDRMPVIVPAEHIDDWLTAPAPEAAALIRPAPEDTLIATAVSRRVNKVANDDAACLAPPQPDAQGSLF